MSRTLELKAKARADRTLDEYAAQWRRFEDWCGRRNLEAIPCEPGTLALYISDLASRLKPASIAMAMSAIGYCHAAAGLAQPNKHPSVVELWAGTRRSLGMAQRRVSPLVVDQLATISRALPRTLAGLRDRALLVLGLAGAMRRSELVALTVGDVQFASGGGLLLYVSRSKTDQEARGVRIGIARGNDPLTCPERTLRAWLKASRLERGPLFRSVRGKRLGASLTGAAVALVIKRAAAAVGLDASSYSGHSLRAGLATSAARAGKADRAIMQQGRWSGRSMVDRYVREARLLDEANASADIGL